MLFSNAELSVFCNQNVNQNLNFVVQMTKKPLLIREYIVRAVLNLPLDVSCEVVVVCDRFLCTTMIRLMI